MGVFPALVLLMLGLVVLAAWAGSVAWVWRDANRRGQPGFIVAVLAALLCWPLSLIVWVAARPNLPGTPAAPRSRGWVWALVAVAAVMIVPIFLGMLLPFWLFFRRAEPSSGHHTTTTTYSTDISPTEAALLRAACLNNLRQIAVAYQEYVAKHDGKCPKTFDDLRVYGVTDQVLQCPAAGGTAIPSYQLLCGTNAADVILRESPANHRGEGGNVAYGDGHVEWVPAAAR